METKERKITVKGRTKIVLIGPDGKVKAKREAENLITDAGFDYLCRQIGESTQQSMHYCAIGTGSTSPSSGDTALEAEVARVSGVYSHTAGTKEFTNLATFGAGVGTGSIREAGLFNANSGGTMLNRQTFGVITKGANDVLKIEWNISLS